MPPQPAFWSACDGRQQEISRAGDQSGNRTVLGSGQAGQVHDQALHRLRRAALFSAICPFCFSDQTVWEESSGEGTIYTYSLMRKSATGPYAIGYVTLKEGPSLQTNFVDCDLEKLKIGQKVKVVFKPTDGAPLPFFTPA
jgi:hypothetical protein